MFLAELVETARCVQVRDCTFIPPPSGLVEFIFSQHEENLIRFGAFASNTLPSDNRERADCNTLVMPSASGKPPVSDDSLEAVAASGAAAEVAEAAAEAAAEGAAAADDSASALKSAAIASGDATDEPALYLRAVAANMQAGKKVQFVLFVLVSNATLCNWLSSVHPMQSARTLTHHAQDIDVPLDAQHIREAYRRMIDGDNCASSILPSYISFGIKVSIPMCRFGFRRRHSLRVPARVRQSSTNFQTPKFYQLSNSIPPPHLLPLLLSVPFCLTI
jgi:hypothetical protein